MKKIGGHLDPSHAHFSPKSPDQNSEIAILFTIVEKPNNYVFGDDLLPRSPRGGAASYKLWPVFTYSNGYWEVYRRFQEDFFLVLGEGWGGGGVTWEDLPMEEFFMGEETFNWEGAGFSSII